MVSEKKEKLFTPMTNGFAFLRGKLANRSTFAFPLPSSSNLRDKPENWERSAESWGVMNLRKEVEVPVVVSGASFESGWSLETNASCCWILVCSEAFSKKY
jgi:hypothetical protein